MNPVLTVSRSHSSGPSTLPRPLRYRLHVSNEVRTFAQVLREVLNRDFGGSNADLARAAGINIGQVGRYLAGQTPRPETIKKMSPHMGVSYHRLMDIAYPKQGAGDTDSGHSLHPLAVQADLLLGEGSAMPADERASLEQVINTVLAPYRKYLRERKVS